MPTPTRNHTLCHTAPFQWLQVYPFPTPVSSSQGAAQEPRVERPGEEASYCVGINEEIKQWGGKGSRRVQGMPVIFTLCAPPPHPAVNPLSSSFPGCPGITHLNGPFSLPRALSLRQQCCQKAVSSSSWLVFWTMV